MATKKTDAEKYRGLPGLKNKYFGQDSEGRTYLQRCFNGAKRGMAFGVNHEDEDKLAVLRALQFVVVFVPTFMASMTVTDRVDVDVPHDSAISSVDMTQDGSAQIYLIGQQHYFEANKYMLVHTDDGYELYQSSSEERIGPDNRFTLVSDNLEASEIAAAMVSRYQSAMHDAQAVAPALLEYEGISPLFIENNDRITEVQGLYPLDTRHRIADDFEARVSDYDLSVHYETWQDAMAQFTSGQNPAESLEPVAEADHFDTAHVEIGEGVGTVFAIYAGLMGLGAAGGALSGINASRRRYNKEIKGDTSASPKTP